MKLGVRTTLAIASLAVVLGVLAVAPAALAGPITVSNSGAFGYWKGILERFGLGGL